MGSPTTISGTLEKLGTTALSSVAQSRLGVLNRSLVLNPSSPNPVITALNQNLNRSIRREISIVNRVIQELLMLLDFRQSLLLVQM